MAESTFLRSAVIAPAIIAAAIIAAATVTATAAFAAENAPAAGERALAIEEVVVTATLGDDSLRDVPSSVSVLGAAEIAARSATHLDDVLGAIANLNFAKGASRARFLQLRGIGERGQFEEPLNSSVGLVVDGVDLSGVGTVAGLYDVQQIEVLRGPQGTLYGANALAGLVNVVTNAPTATAEGRIDASAGSHGTFGVGAVASGPLSERAAGRVVARLDRSDGFIDNDHLGRSDTDNIDETTLRGRLSIDVSDAARIDFAGGLLDADNGYDAFSLDNVRATLSDQPGHDQQETVYGSAKLSVAGASFDTQAHLGAATSDIAYGYDEDWVFPGFHPWGYNSTDNYLRDRSTLTAELRLLSTPAGRLGDATDWIAGLYLLDQDVDLRRQYTYLDADFTSAFGIRRHAAFGQTQTRLGERDVVTVGLRLERHAASYRDSNGNAFDPQDTMFGGRIAWTRELAGGQALYGSLSRGYKAGGFNADGSLDAALRVYEPETLWNYEAGVKVLAGEGRLALRAAVFRMRRDDVQIASSLVRPTADGGSEFIQYVGNAATGSNNGAELELDYLVGDNWQIFARIGLLRTEYHDFTTSSGEDFDGREQAQAPGYQANVGGEWRRPVAGGELFAAVETEMRDDFYFSDNHNFKSDDYRLWHLSAGYRGLNWSLRVWGKNLGDVDYFVRGFLFGNDPRDGYTARGFTQLGAPRQAGVTVSKSW